RVILVKLADRLHNARTFEFLPPHKQIEKAKETLEIYAPLAARLGLWNIKSELEDISFKYLYPDEYKKIVSFLASTKSREEKYLKEEVVPIIENELKKHNINAKIQFRTKHLYSIYEKTLRKNVKLSDIYDINGIRILVNNIKDCYLVLGIIHSTFKPVPGRFKDYISLPKSNLYQALHTTVVGPKGKFVEIQIKTHKMHKIAEEGVAAHWRYKGGEKLSEKDLQSFVWLKNLLDSIKENPSSELIENVKNDLGNEEIFVFTPKGDLVKLPVGATPVDFAYNIHTQVGHKCAGAKVNGKLVPLNTQLKSGDVVEIITSPNKKPNRDWLNFVVSSKAKSNIKSYLHKLERQKSIKFGEKLIDKLLKRIGKSLKSLTDEEKNLLLEKFNFKTFEDFLYALGDGKISLNKVFKVFRPSKQKFKQKSQENKQETEAKIEVDGISNLMCKIASCCRPIPGDDIVGIVTKGKGISIHNKNCDNVL
ncbi:RelA/SpoT family protein, partial [Hydrogenivirga sp. 128-5-R1-1]|uniref:RelA/SpoT family protein n=1 Tax=Hydrogenivirga sp. 128-5-R1-1 TaxID=392423 RepID=UPI00015F09F9